MAHKVMISSILSTFRLIITSSFFVWLNLIIAEGENAQGIPSNIQFSSHLTRQIDSNPSVVSSLQNLTGTELETGKRFNLTDKADHNKEYISSDYPHSNNSNNCTLNNAKNGTTSGCNVTSTEVKEEVKVMKTKFKGIVSEPIDFVLLRLKHISMQTSSNITEILALQQEEFKINEVYKKVWEASARVYNESKREKIFNNTSPDSIVRRVPEEYHIALIGYTSWELSRPFNKQTREVCSGLDVESYKFKSYFKLLQLAIETLGTKEERWRDNKWFLYRGAGIEFVLKEGQVVAFQQFVSTSTEIEVAEEYAYGKTVFEFQGFYNGTALGIWDHSIHEYEREFLLSPLQAYQVKSIHVANHSTGNDSKIEYTRYVLVKHELPTQCDLQTTIT